MKVRVVYIWDSETNSYSQDTMNYDLELQPSGYDRMRWEWRTVGRKPKSGTMNLTRGFEMLMYLAGLANDAVLHHNK